MVKIVKKKFFSRSNHQSKALIKLIIKMVFGVFKNILGAIQAFMDFEKKNRQVDLSIGNV